jgi:hypothetical protein
MILQVALSVDSLDGSELSIGLPPVLVRCGDLEMVSSGALEAARIVGKLLAVVAPNCQEISVPVYTDDPDILAGRDADRTAPFFITDDTVARLVSPCAPREGTIAHVQIQPHEGNRTYPKATGIKDSRRTICAGLSLL